MGGVAKTATNEINNIGSGFSDVFSGKNIGGGLAAVGTGGLYNPNPSTAANSPVRYAQIAPNVMQPYNQYMPQQYFGNKPIYDPTAILQAYAQHLPAFLEAAGSVNNPNMPFIIPKK